MAAFFAVVVPTTLTGAEGEAVDAWVAGSLDATLLFTALLTALIVGEIYRFLVQKNFTIKLPDSVPKAVSAQFTALLPGTAIIVLFTVVRLVRFHPLGRLPGVCHRHYLHPPAASGHLLHRHSGGLLL